MELNKANLQQMAEEFEAKGKSLQKQADKALQAAEHIRQVLTLVDNDDFSTDENETTENPEQTPVTGKMAPIILKTIFDSGGCHINDIVKAVVDADVGTKFSAPKTTYKLRDKGFIVSPEKGMFYPAEGVSFENIAFAPY